MKLATKLLEYINRGRIVEYRVLQSLGITTENSLRVTLSRLSTGGKIYKPMKETYVSAEADPFWAATSLVPGYISLGSALYLHHLADEYPFTIFVGSEEKKSVFLGQREITYFKAKNYRGVERKPYPVASVEKALCDCLLHPEFVGYPRLLKALHHAKVSKKKFLAACKGEDCAFFQRLGYLLSLLPKKDREKNGLLGVCKRKVKSNVYLFGRSKGKYIGGWKLVDNVGKEALLSWWEQ